MERLTTPKKAHLMKMDYFPKIVPLVFCLSTSSGKALHAVPPNIALRAGVQPSIVSHYLPIHSHRCQWL